MLEGMWPAGEGYFILPPFFFNVISSTIEQREMKEGEVQEEEALLRLSLICSSRSFSDPGRQIKERSQNTEHLRYFMTVENTAPKVLLFQLENMLALHINCCGTYY